MLRAIQSFVGKENASVYISGCDGASMLYSSTRRRDFESTPLDGGIQHFLSGGVAGSEEDVIQFVEELSDYLSKHKLSMNFEVYEEVGKRRF